MAKDKPKKDKSQKVTTAIIIDKTTGKKKILKGRELERVGYGVEIKLKSNKQSKRWRPTKGFLYQSVITPETNEAVNYYTTGRNLEEEKEYEKQLNEIFLKITKGVLPSIIEQIKKDDKGRK